MKVQIDYGGVWTIILKEPQGANRLNIMQTTVSFRLTNSDVWPKRLERLMEMGAELTFEKDYIFVILSKKHIDTIKFFENEG